MKWLLFILMVAVNALSAQGGFLEEIYGQKVLHLKGTPYEMGLFHGKTLKSQIAKNITQFVENPNPEFADRIAAFKQNFRKLVNHIPADYLEEMRGIADGANLPLEKIIALNIFPELFHCTALTVKGQATYTKELYHVRVLDYSAGKNLQESAVLIVVEPQNGHAFLNVSYAGFIGTVTGMNDQQIAVGEIGGKGYGNWDGIPMPFLLRLILEKATTLEEARVILTTVDRTCEYYYAISDGKTNDSFGVFATSRNIQFIQPGTPYALIGNRSEDERYLLPLSIENQTTYQTVFYDSTETPVALSFRQPQDCLLMTGFYHPERYPTLVQRVIDSYGSIDEYTLQEIIREPVSRPNNLHNAIFLPSQLKVWIAHAGPNGEPASEQYYYSYSLPELLQHAPTP